MTLIELIVALAIFTLVMSVIAAGIISLYRSSENASGSVYVLASGRTMMSMVLRDLRQATYSDAGAFPIAVMGSHTLSFYANTDSDIFAEKITYGLSGTILSKTVATSSGNPAVYASAPVTEAYADTVVNDLRSEPVFRYYDASGNEAATPADVREIGITLIENESPDTAADVTLTTRVSLRNLLLP